MSIPFAQRPEADVLTGGQPSESDFRDAAVSGFKTVINLRGLGEPGTATQPALMRELGLEYIHLPINGAGDITPENAQSLADALDHAERPVMIHCASGNRIGALFALQAGLKDGCDLEAALERGRAAGLTRMEPLVRVLLQQLQP